MRFTKSCLLFTAILGASSTHAFVHRHPHTTSSYALVVTSSSSSKTLLAAKRARRGSAVPEGSSSSSSSSSPRRRSTLQGPNNSSSSNNNNINARSNRNWTPLSAECRLPEQDYQIGFLDTQLPALQNGATNPTGAVACAKVQDQVYCFQANCPSCQVPLNKANIVKSDETSSSRTLVCQFCQASYDLISGKRVATPTTAPSGGIFSGVVQGLLSANPQAKERPLTLYALGEKEGNGSSKKGLWISLE